jgi:hypothetical protein
MMPHEAQATMAKILFFIFATFVLCLGKARAESISLHKSPVTISTTNTLN